MILAAVCDDADVCFAALKVPYYTHFQILVFIRVEEPHMIPRLKNNQKKKQKPKKNTEQKTSHLASV